MKVKMPGWLYLLLLLDAASVVLLFGITFGGWALPEWLKFLPQLVSTLTLLVWGIWMHKPGGVWDHSLSAGVHIQSPRTFLANTVLRL